MKAIDLTSPHPRLVPTRRRVNGGKRKNGSRYDDRRTIVCLCVGVRDVDCRRFGSESTAPPTPLPRPFGRGYATTHVTALAPYAFESTLIRVRFDVPRGVVFGDEVAIVRAKRSALASFRSIRSAYATTGSR